MVANFVFTFAGFTFSLLSRGWLSDLLSCWSANAEWSAMFGVQTLNFTRPNSAANSNSFNTDTYSGPTRVANRLSLPVRNTSALDLSAPSSSWEDQPGRLRSSSGLFRLATGNVCTNILSDNDKFVWCCIVFCLVRQKLSFWLRPPKAHDFGPFLQNSKNWVRYSESEFLAVKTLIFSEVQRNSETLLQRKFQWNELGKEFKAFIFLYFLYRKRVSSSKSFTSS